MLQEPVPYVDQESLAIAEKMEDKFVGLLPEAGVIFVGVSPVPTETGTSKEFQVRLGFRRGLPIDEDTGMAIIRFILKDEMKKYEIGGSVFFGRPGAFRGDHLQS